MFAQITKRPPAPSAALTEIARLLARQAARELARAARQKTIKPIKPTPSEDRS